MADTLLEENSALIVEIQNWAASLPDASGGTATPLGLTDTAVGNITKVKSVEELETGLVESQTVNKILLGEE